MNDDINDWGYWDDVEAEENAHGRLPAAPCSAKPFRTMKTDTPETDRERDHAANILADCEREAHQTGSDVDAWVVDVEFARKLERERDEAREIAWQLQAAAPDYIPFPWEQNSINRHNG